MLHPIILAGSVHPSSDRQAGEGPMHFERSPGIPSRFEQVVAHLTGEVFASPLVVATQDCGPLVEAQTNHARIILEPDTHKPAAALLSAVLSLRHEPDAIVVVAPASANLEDQYVPPSAENFWSDCKQKASMDDKAFLHLSAPTRLILYSTRVVLEQNLF